MCAQDKLRLFGHEDCQRPSVAYRHLDASIVEQKISETLGSLREGHLLDTVVVLHNKSG